MSENIPLPNPSIRWGVAPINQASVTSNRGLGNAKDSMAARKIRNRSSMIGQTGSKKLILSRLDPGLRNADAKVSEMIEDRPLTLFLEMGDSKQYQSFNRIFLSTTFGLLIALTLIVCFVGGFNLWIGIIGGIGTNLVALIFPCSFYMLVTAKPTWKNKYYAISYVTYVWGWITMALALFCQFW